MKLNDKQQNHIFVWLASLAEKKSISIQRDQLMNGKATKLRFSTQSKV